VSVITADSSLRFSTQSKTPRRAQGTLAVLDIGTTKMVCAIAEVSSDHSLKVIGVGHRVSAGVRHGIISDMEEAAAAIAEVVQAAEAQAGQNVRRLMVAVGGAHIASEDIRLSVRLYGQQVNSSILRKALVKSRQIDSLAGVEVLHTLPIDYSLDGNAGVQDPRGMVGEQLQMRLNVVTASQAAVRNLRACIHRSHLEIEGLVSTAMASGYAVLNDDERMLGTTLVDMGGGTSNVIVFHEGSPVFACCLPIGGHHVTTDLACGLSTPIVEAERAKILHGSAQSSDLDDQEEIDIAQIGGDGPDAVQSLPRSYLVNIIRPRLEETFELLRDRLEAAGVADLAGRRVVLTGGAAQLPGAAEVAADVLDKQVRIGRPAPMSGLPRDASGPAFATTVGLLTFALSDEASAGANQDFNPPSGLFGRLGHWLKENF